MVLPYGGTIAFLFALARGLAYYGWQGSGAFYTGGATTESALKIRSSHQAGICFDAL